MGRYFWLILAEFFLVTVLIGAVFLRATPIEHSRTSTYSQLEADRKKIYNEESILGIEVSKAPTLLPTITITEEFRPAPTSTPTKSSYRILVYGDSMEETMGKSANDLASELKRVYPLTTFSIYNYSRGAQNVEEAYNYWIKLRNSSPVDIILVGSFSYNPFVPHSLSKHTEYLTLLINKLKETRAAVYLLVEIAPDKSLFGTGPGGVDLGENYRYIQATNVIALLENSLKIAKALNIPAVNVFEDSVAKADKSGDLRYISSYDYLHPSSLGHQFTAQKIVEQLILN